MGHAYANYFNEAYIVSYRKMPKKKTNSPFNFLAKKSDNFNPYLLQALSYNDWPVIAVLRQCTDGMATV